MAPVPLLLLLATTALPVPPGEPVEGKRSPSEAAAPLSPSLPAARTSAPPVLDGRLDEPVWQRAPLADRFTQKLPADGAPPSERTTVRVLYDDQAVYVGISCEQRQSPIVARLTRRDRMVEADSVTVALGTRRDGLSAFRFDVNAAGVLSDGLYYDDTEYNRTWDENWDARTTITESGWTAELVIPLRVLRFEAEPRQTWGFNVRRYIADRQETDEWAYVPQTESGLVSRFGHLDNLDALTPPRADFELRPFVVGRLSRQDAAGAQGIPPFGGLGGGTRRWDAGERRYAAGGLVGTDLRWHPTRDLVLDATLNPDFGQVEADEVVLNLSTIETFYPEKRPFFQEGLDLFNSQRSLVHTRRIGRTPAAPMLLPGETALDPVGPSTIPAALKLVGRPVPSLHVGLLSALTEPNRVRVSDAAGNVDQRLVDPWTAYNVLRLKEVSGNGVLGLLATATNRFENRGDLPRDANGDRLCPGESAPRDGSCFRDAYVASLDGRWRPGGGDYVLAGQALASWLEGGPTLLYRDGTQVGPGATGTGGAVDLEKDGGRHLLLWAHSEASSRTLEFNDLGFQRRQNVWRSSAWLTWRTTEPWGPTLSTRSRFELYDERNLDDLVLARHYQLNSSWQLQSFWRVRMEVHHRALHYDDREVGDGTALARAGLWGWELEVSSDPRRAVVLASDLQLQKLTDGTAAQWDATISFHPLPRWDLDLGPSLVYTHGEPRYVGAGSDPQTLLFGRLDARSLATTLRSTFTFTPRLTLQTFAQLFVAAGRYSDFSSWSRTPGRTHEVIGLGDLTAGAAAPATVPDFQRASLNANVVLRWEYRLGAALYLVYARTQTPAVTLDPGQRPQLALRPLGNAPATDVFLIKLSYWFG